jgi:hypothetical protein
MRSVIIVLLMLLIVGGAPLAQPSVARTPASPGDSLAGSSGVSVQENDYFWMGWSLPVNVSQCPTNQATYATLGTTGGGQTLYLAWTDGREAYKDIYYASSADGGWQWETPQSVLTTAADSWRPSMVMSGTTPLLAWAETTSPLDRETYQLALGAVSPAIVPNAHSTLAYAPRLAWGAGGELHLTLQGGLGTTQSDILYSHRAAGATAWPTATLVFTHTASGSSNPALAVSADGQTVHLVWQENFSGDQSEIYYLRGQQSGEEVLWETPVSLSGGITRSVRPAIVAWTAPTATGKVVAGETIHVAWAEQMAGFEQQYVRYSRSDDGGLDWSAPERIASEPLSVNNVAPTDIAPTLAVSPSGIPCVAWHGFRPDAAFEAEEIYLSCSTDGGARWAAPVNVSRSPETISIRPVLAIGSNGILNVAWQELAGSDPVNEYQIYYARSLPYAVMMPLVRK